MPKLGSDKRRLVARVKTLKRAQEITALCDDHGWKVVVGIEPDKPEDISDIERLLKPETPVVRATHVGRNDPCPCGSELNYKKCCLNK